MSNLCFHKFGKVEGGYQYCQKCGIAIAAPKVECNHKWIYKWAQDTKGPYGNTYKRTLLYECEKCGELKQEVLK